jgi:hypothetical protein
MRKLLTVIAVVLGLTFSLAGHAIQMLDKSTSEYVLLNGEAIASGTSEDGNLHVLMKYSGKIYRCYVGLPSSVEDGLATVCFG